MLTLTLWHVGCDGATVSVQKQQEGSFSDVVAPYEEKLYIPDESESYVRMIPREFNAHHVIKLQHPLLSPE
jgi:hypothetical protein